MCKRDDRKRCKFSIRAIQERLEDNELHTCKALVTIRALFAGRSSTRDGRQVGLACGIAGSVLAAIGTRVVSSGLGQTKVVIETIIGGTTLDWIGWFTRALSIVIVNAFLRSSSTLIGRVAGEYGDTEILVGALLIATNLRIKAVERARNCIRNEQHQHDDKCVSRTANNNQ